MVGYATQGSSNEWIHNKRFSQLISCQAAALLICLVLQHGGTGVCVVSCTLQSRRWAGPSSPLCVTSQARTSPSLYHRGPGRDGSRQWAEVTTSSWATWQCHHRNWWAAESILTATCGSRGWEGIAGKCSTDWPRRPRVRRNESKWTPRSDNGRQMKKGANDKVERLISLHHIEIEIWIILSAQQWLNATPRERRFPVWGGPGI